MTQLRRLGTVKFFQPKKGVRIMMQANEIQQRFSHVQQTIGEAEQVCMQSSDAPPQLRDVINKLAREMEQAKDAMQSNDESRIRQCVQSLESLGDEAKRVSRSEAQVPAHLETMVSRVHAELSDFKHQLH
jgi:phage shock protein A